MNTTHKINSNMSIDCETNIDCNEMKIIPLGAGCEVGRSCIVVEFKGRVLMFDCGIHPGFSGIGALPIFDSIDTSSVDLCLVTHFHLDHCGALPYFVSKTLFKGKILMTEPTRAIAKLFWNDYATLASYRNRGSKSSVQDSEYHTDDSFSLFDASDIAKCMDCCDIIDFRQTLEYPDLGIKVTCYAAGHVLGACMFSVEIDGIRVLYTGDFSREKDRHVPIAEEPDLLVNVLICESTYGIRVHEPRLQRENRFIQFVLNIIKRDGKCLIPIFALGRAQELLLILEEYWKLHPKLHCIPIWYCSPMSSKSMPFFETFISFCGDYLKNMVDNGMNPFHFQFIKTAKSISDMKHDVYTPGTPCIIVASPGMLQNGTSREIFKLWCNDPLNGVILTGYSIKGTLIDELKKNPYSVQLQQNGPNVKVRSSFEMISFSAHSDFEQTFGFIEKVQPQIVVLVHGERSEMTRLSEKLKELRPQLAIFTPEILQTVSLRFPKKCQALALGNIVNTLVNAKRFSNKPVIGGVILLEAHSDSPKIVDTQYIKKNYRTTKIIQTLTVDFAHEYIQSLLRNISSFYEDVQMVDETLVCVCQSVEVKFFDIGILQLSWTSDPLSDIVANSLCFMILNFLPEKQNIIEDCVDIIPSDDEIVDILILSLEHQFGKLQIEKNEDSRRVIVTIYDYENDKSNEVFGSDECSNTLVRNYLRRIEHSLLPLPFFN